MTKSETGKPRSAVMWSGLDSSLLSAKYLLEYFGGLQLDPSPFNIKDFAANFLNLDIVSTVVDLPYIKAFIVYSPMEYINAVTDCPISVNPGTVILNEDIEIDTPEGRFILAHEAGHWIIRRERDYTTCPNYSCCKSFEQRVDYLDIDKINQYIATDPDAMSEIMADCIAHAILMPTNAFLPLSMELMNTHGFLDDRIIVGERPEAEAAVIRQLAETFLVPGYAVRNNLFAYGLLARN